MTPPDDATSRRLAAVAARPTARAGWTPDPVPSADPGRAQDPRTVDAMREAGRAYTAAYGHPTERVVPERRRVRWQVPWRLVVPAAVALLVLAGGVALHSAAGAAGPAVELPVPQAALVSATTPDPSGSPTAPVTVLVHVVGAVAAAGVVRLPAGARVVDAVAAAGGAAPDADLARVNLARPVVDGEQIVVPRPGEVLPSAPTGAGGAAPVAGPATLVDLNTADVAALDALPGIGPVLAQRIVEHRASSPFGTVDELGDVSGIGPTLLEKLRPLVRV